jgi:hypothetical protein
MAWYVFALVDAPPASRPGKGLSGSLGLRRVGNAYAVVERRADVPPTEFGTLQRHHAVVTKLADRVPAILPVRFGTLLDGDALDEALAEREDDIAAAFDVVRDRVQSTWRLARPGARREGRIKTTARAPKSGAEYLRRAARASHPSPPASWRNVRTVLAPLVAAERYQPAAASMPDSLYHLVARDSSIRYATMGRALVHANPALTMTGPWPPFAFASEPL